MSNPRTSHLSIRFTQEERAMIARAAERENRSAANWARMILLARCPDLSAGQDGEPAQEAA